MYIYSFTTIKPMIVIQRERCVVSFFEDEITPTTKNLMLQH